MKRTLLRSITFAILLTASACSTLHASSTSVYVTEIEGKYLIRFVNRGILLAPLTPEGPFPRRSDVSTFQTDGKGEMDDQGGITFLIGKNIESQYEKYDRGRVSIREAANEIELDAKLSAKYRDAANHSGRYACSIIKPAIHPIEGFANQEAMVGNYIRARGRFDYDRFRSGLYVFSDRHVDFVAGPGKHRGHRGPERMYEVIGRIQKNPADVGYEIRVFSATPIE